MLYIVLVWVVVPRRVLRVNEAENSMHPTSSKPRWFRYRRKSADTFLEARMTCCGIKLIVARIVAITTRRASILRSLEPRCYVYLSQTNTVRGRRVRLRGWVWKARNISGYCNRVPATQIIPEFIPFVWYAAYLAPVVIYMKNHSSYLHGVSTAPGQTALHVTPEVAFSRAVAWKQKQPFHLGEAAAPRNYAWS